MVRGLPPSRPLAFAAARPARVRSESLERSYSARDANISKISLPWAQVERRPGASPAAATSDTEIDSNRLGHLSDCRVIDVPKSDLTGISFGPAGASWALPPIEGATSAATEASNGAQHRHAIPNIVSTRLPVDRVLIAPVVNESMASLTPHELPGEFIPTVASPQLNDSGILEWNFPSRPLREMRGIA